MHNVRITMIHNDIYIYTYINVGHTRGSYGTVAVKAGCLIEVLDRRVRLVRC